MERLRCLLFVDQEMVAARNEKNAHAHDSVVHDGPLLPVLKTFAQCTCLLHTARNAWMFSASL